MKKLIVVIFVVIVLLVSGLMVGCGAVLKGSGNLKTEEYSFSNFNKVEISSAFEFEISRSSAYSISITADDNVIEKVRVIQAGYTLKIYVETLPMPAFLTLKAVITMPELRGLYISGAAHGTISEFSSADDVDIRLSGASKVECNIIAGGADFNVSGASIVRLMGSAKDMVANVSGASHFHLDDFTVNSANVTISGASTGAVNVSGHLDANVSGASKLSYIGEPTMGTINTSGASALSKK